MVRLVRDGRDIPLSTLTRSGSLGGPSTVEAIYDEYRGGATIVLHSLHERLTPVTQLCRALTEEFSAGFQVNAYLTPAQSQGLGVHYDTHDVFVLQIEGVKHWRIFGAPLQLPLEGQPFRRGKVEAGPLEEEVELHPGDLIYLPRGFMHSASSKDSTSLHLTVGAVSVTWASVILGAIESCIEQEPGLRASLPPGFATRARLHKKCEAQFVDMMLLLSQLVVPELAIRNATEMALLGQRRGSLEGRLLDLEAESEIGLETRLRRRPPTSSAKWRPLLTWLTSRLLL
jgi:hypothetical protein